MPKKTLTTIIQTKNDYITALKRNQKKLYTRCSEIMAFYPLDDFDERDSHGHGRTERRTISVWNAPPADDPLAIDPAWVGLHRIIKVDRLRRVGKKDPTLKTFYYITSRRDDSAYDLGNIIREHWGIENRLHWVKDVQQNEDNNGIQPATPAKNISLLKTWALSIFRVNGHDSIKHASITFANKISKLAKLVKFPKQGRT